MKPGWMAALVGTLTGAAIFLFSRKSSKSKMKDLPLPNCNDSLKADKHGSSRQPSKIRLIVIHSTEGGSAAGAAGWFTNKASGGSAHVVVDDKECYRTLPDDMIPWGAKGGRANEDGLHIEFTGYAKWSRDEWLKHQAELEKGAAIISNWAKMYNIPLQFLDAEDLEKAGNSAHGITTHHELTKAFKIDGGHTDPGNGFPMDVLFYEMGADYKPNPYV